MQWKDNRHKEMVTFAEVCIGDVFIDFDNTINIKINREEGFDICNNRISSFQRDDQGEIRNATLILE